MPTNAANLRSTHKKLGYGASQNKNRANYLRSAAEKRAKTLKNATNIKHSKVRKTRKTRC